MHIKQIIENIIAAIFVRISIESLIPILAWRYGGSLN